MGLAFFFLPEFSLPIASPFSLTHITTQQNTYFKDQPNSNRNQTKPPFQRGNPKQHPHPHLRGSKPAAFQKVMEIRYSESTRLLSHRPTHSFICMKIDPSSVSTSSFLPRSHYPLVAPEIITPRERSGWQQAVPIGGKARPART